MVQLSIIVRNHVQSLSVGKYYKIGTGMYQISPPTSAFGVAIMLIYHESEKRRILKPFIHTLNFCRHI